MSRIRNLYKFRNLTTGCEEPHVFVIAYNKTNKRISGFWIREDEQWVKISGSRNSPDYTPDMYFNFD